MQREYNALRSQVSGFCGCEVCHGDVLVYALNRLPPHYVSTRQGEVLTGITLGTDQERARVSVILLEGFRRVALAPRCGAQPTQLL